MAASCQVDYPALSDVRDIEVLAAAQKRKLFLFFGKSGEAFSDRMIMRHLNE